MADVESAREAADGEVLLLQAVANGHFNALHAMVTLLASSFGPRGARIGQLVRALPGVLTALVAFVESTDDTATCSALHVLANICSDAVDMQSALTKRQLLEEPGGAEAIFSLLTDDEADVGCRVGAAACLQNLCSDSAWAFVLAEESEVVRDMEYLIHSGGHEEPQLVRYTLGALANAARVSANTAGCKGFSLSEKTWKLVGARREATEEERNARSQALTKLRAAVRLNRPTRRAQPPQGEPSSSASSVPPTSLRRGSSSDSSTGGSSTGGSSTGGSSTGGSISSIISSRSDDDLADGSRVSSDGTPTGGTPTGGGTAGESGLMTRCRTTCAVAPPAAGSAPSVCEPKPSEEPTPPSPTPPTHPPSMGIPSPTHSLAKTPLPRLTPRGLMLTSDAEAGGTARTESGAAESSRGSGAGVGMSGWSSARQMAMARIARVPPPPKWPTVEKMPVTKPKVTPRLDQLSSPKKLAADVMPRARRFSKELMPGSPPSPVPPRSPAPVQTGEPLDEAHEPHSPPHSPSAAASSSPQRRRTSRAGQPPFPVSTAGEVVTTSTLDLQNSPRKSAATTGTTGSGTTTSFPPLMRM